MGYLGFLIVFLLTSPSPLPTFSFLRGGYCTRVEEASSLTARWALAEELYVFVGEVVVVDPPG